MPRYLLINNAILFCCCSIYLGIGIFLVFFLFPLEPKLTIDNYAMLFVDPVAYATDFLTYMTILMLITCAIMLATEWLSGLRWIPVVILALVIGSTIVEVYFIFPHNELLNSGVKDPEQLRTTFSAWASLNRIRFSSWCIQWLVMMYYFYNLAYKGRMDR